MDVIASPSPRARSLPLGDYAFVGCLQASSHTVVCRARDHAGRAVVVKGAGHHADPRTCGRLAAEARRLRGLEHPHIVSVLDDGVIEAVGPWAAHLRPSSFALVLPLAAGGSLDPWCGWVAWAELRPILRQLLTALSYLHRAGMLHCDLKPANVLVLEDQATPRVELADFDAALPWDPRQPQPVEASHGTPGYMAPEQHANGAPLGPWTDLFGIGCLAWALLCGQSPPLDGPEPAAMPSRTHVPPALVAWLQTLLAPRGADRFDRAEVALAALNTIDPKENRP